MDTMNCVLTGEPINYKKHTNTISYELRFANETVEVFVCNCYKDKLNPNYYHIVKGLIANGKWPQRSFITSKDCTTPAPIDSSSIIPDIFLATAIYPRTPAERMDNLFLNLFKIQKTDGEYFHLDKNSSLWIKNYFRTDEELLFYIEVLVSNGLIRRAQGLGVHLATIGVTFLGLTKAIELREKGINSNKCFVAMAFNNKMIPFREAIKRAIIETGFSPVIIDEENLESNQTIPDGILSKIRESKFCIADFSQHRNGVYFESGYALGLGKPVIYTCEKDEFEKAHFDIKQLQHIIYKTPAELEQLLKDKIEVWIKG